MRRRPAEHAARAGAAERSGVTRRLGGSEANQPIRDACTCRWHSHARKGSVSRSLINDVRGDLELMLCRLVSKLGCSRQPSTAILKWLDTFWSSVTRMQPSRTLEEGKRMLLCWQGDRSVREARFMTPRHRVAVHECSLALHEAAGGVPTDTSVVRLLLSQTGVNVRRHSYGPPSLAAAWLLCKPWRSADRPCKPCGVHATPVRVAEREHTRRIAACCRGSTVCLLSAS